MRKIIAYLIISLFLLSTISGSVVAKNVGGDVKNQNVAFGKVKPKIQEKNLERLQKLQERRLEKLQEFNQTGSNPKLSKYKKNLNFKARKINQNRLIKAKQNYLKAKERYETARQNYLSAQNGFREAKNRINECEGNETDECNQWREEIKERAKEFLLKTADNILEHLNKVKANTESNEDLSEEEAAEILEKINAMIQEIEDAKSIIESSEDKDEIIEAAKTIKEAWSRIRKRLAIHTGRIVNARIGGIIVKIKQLEVKLERILERMENNGIDTSEMQSLVDDFNNKTDEAKDYYEQALDKFQEAADAEDVKTAHQLAKEGHRLMKASHKALQEAQHILRDIVLSIKQGGGELEEPEEECTEDADCEEGKVCTDGECEEVEEECTVDADCDEDEVCQDGSCIRLECETIDDCPEDMTCKDGECAEIECTVTEDCDEDEVCQDGSCIRLECETTDDCPEDMTCKDGECAEIECTVTEDCDEDEVCTDGLCVRAEEECTEADEQCCLGDVCNSVEITCEEGFIPEFQGCEENCSVIASCVEEATT